MTSSHSYSRRRPSRTPRPSIVILVEGKVTEPEYLNAFKEALRIPNGLVEIEKSRCTDANGIVGEARELLAKSRKKRGGENFDEIWVVADAESEHENGSSENISHAINQAGDDVHLVLDSPSIEYWFLLHFVRTTRDFPTATDVIAELRRHWPGYSKQSRKLDWSALIEKTEPAMQNAAYVRRMRRSSRASRPLADMDVLAAKLGSMGKQSIPRAEAKVTTRHSAFEPPTCKDLYSQERLHQNLSQ